MAKRRTRKEKETAKHTFTISWNPDSTSTTVKSQKLPSEPTSGGKVGLLKSAVPMALDLDLASIRHNILKSLGVSFFIITFELVIYFFWK